MAVDDPELVLPAGEGSCPPLIQKGTSVNSIDRDRSDFLQGVFAHPLSRRAVLQRATALSLSAPAIAAVLAACGDDDDDETPAATATTGAAAATPTAAATSAPAGTPAAGPTPTPPAPPTAPSATTAPATPTTAPQAGGGGLLRLLWWQAPTILNPHLSQGGKDRDASRLTTEPLAEFNDAGDLVPFLAAEIPTVENGGLAEDGTSVTWTLREGVTWHDGEPFTAADVKFTYEWLTDPENTVTTSGSYTSVTGVETPDDFTVVVTFSGPTPAWFLPFVGDSGRILPEHIMRDFMGTNAPNAPFNLKPVGTGPFVVTEFRPGDVVLAERYPDYWAAGKPFFDEIELKGGGDAASAARAVLESGEVDYAWNLQVEAALLEEMGDGGTGTIVAPLGTFMERIVVNMTDPHTEVDGERSKLGTPHPFLADLAVRQALALGIDRDTIASELYGATGQPTPNFIVAPERFVSPNTSYEYSVEQATQALDAAGWTGSPRTRDGVSMSIVFQTTINPVRQKTQEIIKQAYDGLGVPVEIKAIDGAVFFSSDAGNPDTWQHFYADFQMWTGLSESPYPINYLRHGISVDPAKDIPQKANNWTGLNMGRWVNEEYNAAYQQALAELETDKQVELFFTMNDLMVNEVVHIPLVHRATVRGAANGLTFSPSRWTTDLWDIADWYLEQ